MLRLQGDASGGRKGKSLILIRKRRSKAVSLLALVIEKKKKMESEYY